MLTRENLHGIWAAVPLEWDENYNFNVDVFKENTKRICENGAHAIYTTGSTGEFYALDLEEFKIMVDAFVEVTSKYDINTGVGTTALNTREVLRMAEYCAEKGIESIMPAFPPWIQLREDEQLHFLQQVCAVDPDMAVIHYNISRTKILYEGKDYKRVLPHLPKNFIGSKSTKADYMYQYNLFRESPELVHFPGESFFVPNMMLGGKGIITVVYCMNPQFCVDWYNLCVDKKWDEAMRYQHIWNDYLMEVAMPVIEKGYWDPAIDRAQVIAAGFLTGSNRIREPYLPVPDEDIAKMRQQMLEKYPELVYDKG